MAMIFIWLSNVFWNPQISVLVPKIHRFDHIILVFWQKIGSQFELVGKWHFYNVMSHLAIFVCVAGLAKVIQVFDQDEWLDVLVTGIFDILLLCITFLFMPCFISCVTILFYAWFFIQITVHFHIVLRLTHIN